jgi:DNA-directed RNA polymerase subunit RPC12/RpoP
MNCPECGKRMEQENCPFVSSIEFGERIGDLPKIEKTPSVHYNCVDCDTEWTKISRGKLRKLDGAEKPIHSDKTLKTCFLDALYNH